MEGAPSYKFPPTLASGADYHIDFDPVADSNSAQSIHMPDIPFRNEEDALPGTIIEVAYSQPSKNLRNLAYTYLVHSNAAVQVVFGFNIKGGLAQRATFSAWQSKDEDDVLSMVIEYYYQVCDLQLIYSFINISRNFVVPMENLQVTVHSAFGSKTLQWMTPQKIY